MPDAGMLQVSCCFGTRRSFTCSVTEDEDVWNQAKANQSQMHKNSNRNMVTNISKSVNGSCREQKPHLS